MKKVLDGKHRRKTLGCRHPDTLTSMNNLTNVLDRQGKYEEAEQMHRKTLALMETLLGLEHPKTCQSRRNLAKCLKAREEETPGFSATSVTGTWQARR